MKDPMRSSTNHSIDPSAPGHPALDRPAPKRPALLDGPGARTAGRAATIGRTARALAAAALAVGIGLVAAADADARRGWGGERRLDAVLEKLDVDEATRAAARGIVEEARPATRALREQVREAHRSLRALLEQAEPDEDAVLAQVETLGELRTELRKRQLRTLLEVRAVLPDEARAQLQELMQKKHRHRCRGKHRHERGERMGT